MRPTATVLVGSFILFLGTVAVFGQGSNSSVEGAIRDETGGIILAAEIRLINLNTGRLRQALSNEAGRYFFASVPPGRYSLHAELLGFKTYVEEDFEVVVAQRVQIEYGKCIRGLPSGHAHRRPGDLHAAHALSLDAVRALHSRHLENRARLDPQLGPLLVLGNSARSWLSAPRRQPAPLLRFRHWTRPFLPPLARLIPRSSGLTRTTLLPVSGWSGSVASPNFGQITSTAEARQIQFGLKLLW
ncbi:MAG: carboxypeptidase-like regulatory domain-containing protein [Acidobacteriota bacterium]